MIINDSDKDWTITKSDGMTIIVKPNEAYDPSTEQVLTIEKPS